jgi:hypothetical protein
MKTTVEVFDDLYRRAKSEAALRGRKLKDLVEEGLRLVLETPRPPPCNAYEGRARSGEIRLVDLASNPERLKDFGRDGSRHR